MVTNGRWTYRRTFCHFYGSFV